MKLLVLSDVHGNSRYLGRVIDVVKDFDALLIAGDLSNYGSGMDGVLSVLKEVVSTGVPVITVLGNMDPPNALGKVDSVGVKVLHGSSTKLSSYYVLGVSGSPKTPFRTLFELSEGEFNELLTKASEGIEDFRKVILLTHAPPYGTKVDRVFIGIHAGSVAIREFIKYKKPLTNFCGHIHEGRGTELLGETTVINPGPLFKKYYCVVELINDSLSYELRRL